MSGEFSNEWETGGYWDYQMFDIYMNFGEGKFENTLRGRNLKILDGWDYVLTIHPNVDYDLKEDILKENQNIHDDISKFENISKNILFAENFYTKEGTLFISISKLEIQLDKVEKIQVFALALDYYNNISNVDKVNSEWKFGGGSKYIGDSNVIDILGDNRQMDMYESKNGYSEFAEIEMISIK